MKTTEDRRDPMSTHPEQRAAWSPQRVVCGVDAGGGPPEVVEQALALSASPAGVQFVSADPVEVLLAAADDADLLTVEAAHHSRVVGILLGDVATSAAHHAHCDLLIARPLPAERPFAADLLLAYDGSPGADRAAAAAAAIARDHDSRVTVASFAHADGARREAVARTVVDLTEATGREPVVVSGDGDPHESIVQIASAVESSLIVMGARGVTGLRALGSVSERVAHEAPCSVLITRGGDR